MNFRELSEAGTISNFADDVHGTLGKVGAIAKSVAGAYSKTSGEVRAGMKDANDKAVSAAKKQDAEATRDLRIKDKASRAKAKFDAGSQKAAEKAKAKADAKAKAEAEALRTQTDAADARRNAPRLAQQTIAGFILTNRTAVDDLLLNDKSPEELKMIVSALPLIQSRFSKFIRVTPDQMATSTFVGAHDRADVRSRIRNKPLQKYLATGENLLNRDLMGEKKAWATVLLSSPEVGSASILHLVARMYQYYKKKNDEAKAKGEEGAFPTGLNLFYLIGAQIYVLQSRLEQIATSVHEYTKTPDTTPPDVKADAPKVDAEKPPADMTEGLLRRVGKLSKRL